MPHNSLGTLPLTPSRPQWSRKHDFEIFGILFFFYKKKQNYIYIVVTPLTIPQKYSTDVFEDRVNSDFQLLLHNWPVQQTS